ncbi:MAG: hypothetical protein P4L79_09790 [Legionella sp.]|uniref:hypothetical protein n=1 Tax=Legionella sp. TaxID=459 RepID=UPI002840380C|nr:hypothetical protein [Legionella sp.]
MANTLIQVLRTSVSGRAANTSTLTSPGQLALNMPDGILYSTNGSVVFEIGANNTNVNVSNTIFIGNTTANVVANSTGITIANSSGSVSINPLTTFGGGSGVNTANQYMFTNTISVLSLNASSNINVGANVYINATTYFIGNSTVYSTSNSTTDSWIDPNGSLTTNSTSCFVGNSTVYSTSNSTTDIWVNQTNTLSINASTISINGAIVPVLGKVYAFAAGFILT